jgi:hypothetical protein
MPGGDRTGPLGLGPRTGRALGYCAGSDVPGYAHPGFGRGFGFGRGRGRGYGRGFWGRGRGFWGRGRYPYPAPYYPEPYIEPSREEEKAYLEDMIKGLEEEMKLIRERLQELSKEKKETP